MPIEPVYNSNGTIAGFTRGFTSSMNDWWNNSSNIDNNYENLTMVRYDDPPSMWSSSWESVLQRQDTHIKIDDSILDNILKNITILDKNPNLLTTFHTIMMGVDRLLYMIKDYNIYIEESYLDELIEIKDSGVHNVKYPNYILTTHMSTDDTIFYKMLKIFYNIYLQKKYGLYEFINRGSMLYKYFYEYLYLILTYNLNDVAEIYQEYYQDNDLPLSYINHIKKLHDSIIYFIPKDIIINEYELKGYFNKK